MSSTPRDQIFRVIHEIDRTDQIKITVADVQDEVNEDLSKYTVRHALNGLAKVGVLSHPERSPYWYIK